MNIAIIPARSGSRRIPRKNIKIFCGKPMIAYAINAAKESGLFEYIIVSTDDEEIAQIARKYGALTPFIRPKELANDYIETIPVIAHAINTCLSFGWKFDKVCCIYPSVPFIQIDDLENALDLIFNKNNDSFCFPVTEYPSAIQRALKLLKNKKTVPFNPEFEIIRTQDLETAYYDAGQFYWAKKETWLKNLKIHSNGIGYVIPNWRVVDIDNEIDWHKAEIMYNVTFN